MTPLSSYRSRPSLERLSTESRYSTNLNPPVCTCLATDWSKDGIGYWLFQKHCDCFSGDLFCCRTGWKITLIGSHFTHPAESRYASIEGEALAVAMALDKARHFVLGCSDLTIATDHKPLLKIFGDRSLDQIGNTRLRNLKEKTLPYRFRMIHIPGVKNQTPDALSRYPTGTPTPERLVLQDDVHAVLDQAPTRWPQPPTSGISLIDSLDDSEDMHGDHPTGLAGPRSDFDTPNLLGASPDGHG